MKKTAMTMACAVALLASGCAKDKETAQAVPVAVDEGKPAPSAAQAKAGGAAEGSAVPDKKALQKAGALHPDKPSGHPTALPPGHPPVLPEGHPPVAGQGNAKGGGKGKGFVATQIAEKVAPATGDNAKTIAAIFAEKDALKGKPVRVRGKVVKFNAQIMGRNWVHIQDGSGSADKGDHDLTITTEETAKVGDTVTFEGPLTVGKDFGAGYAYDVIMESGTLAK